MFARSISIFPVHVYDAKSAPQSGISRPNGFSEYQLMYTTKGTGVLTDLYGKRHNVGVGDVMYIPANEKHKYYQTGDYPWAFTYISFGGESVFAGLPRIFSLPENSRVFPKESFSDPDVTADIFRRCAELYAERSYIDDLMSLPMPSASPPTH